jgi:hypothetical protein
MPDSPTLVNRNALRGLLAYAARHSHSRFWIPALYVLAARLGVILHA